MALIGSVSGSLTKLTSGDPYLIGGAGLSVVSGSSGAINLAVVAAGSDTQIQFNDGGSLGGDSGLTYNKTSDTLSGVSGSFYQLAASNALSSGGSLSVAGLSTFTGASTHNGGISTTTLGASGNASIGGTLGVTGNVTLNNALQAGATTLGSLGVTGNATVAGKLVVTGDLEVNGTTTTVDATTVTIEDPLIALGFTSGSVAVAAGDRGLVGGISGGDNVVMFWDNSESEFAVARTASSPDSAAISVASYGKFHADVVRADGGLSGSLTKLVDGSSAFVAGTGVVITSASNGSVVISAASGGQGIVAGSDTQIQFNDGGSFGADSGLTYNKTSDTLSGVSGSFYQLAASNALSSAGTLTVQGAAVLNGGLSMDSGAFSVADTSGNVASAGTLQIAGLATLNGGLTMDGGVFSVADASGNVSTQGTLSVLGAASLNSSLSVVGNITGQGVSNQLNALAVTGSLGVAITADLAVNGGDITSSATSFNLLNSTVTSLFLGGDATTVQIGASTGTTAIKNALTVDGNVTLGNASGDLINFTGQAGSSLLPSADVTYNLGSAEKRWANIYTGDLHLRNERGDYTLIEEPDFLTVRFNKSGKRYKFVLEAVPEFDEELGNFSSGPKSDA